MTLRFATWPEQASCPQTCIDLDAATLRVERSMAALPGAVSHLGTPRRQAHRQVGDKSAKGQRRTVTTPERQSPRRNRLDI